MKELKFFNLTDFKEFLNSLKENNNKEYYIIYLNNININTFEENINFNGDLIFYNCIIKKIKGTFDINRLDLTDCRCLNELNLFSSINSLIISRLNRYIVDKTLKILGNYPNLNYFSIKTRYKQQNITIDGNFNNNEQLIFEINNKIKKLEFKGHYNNFYIRAGYKSKCIDGNKNIIIDNLILNNYYKQFYYYNNYLHINNIIYKTLNKFYKLEEIYENAILDDDNISCEKLTFSGYELKKTKSDTYNNLKSILCLNSTTVINGDFNNLNKISLRNAENLTLNGNFNNDLLIKGNVDNLILTGNFKKINYDGYIKNIICINSICGNFELFDEVYCENCKEIKGNFNNLSIVYNNDDDEDDEEDYEENKIIICNVKNNCTINNIKKLNTFIGVFNKLFISNCKNINLSNIIVNDLSIYNCNFSNLPDNLYKIENLQIANSNIKELNDKFYNLKSLELNNCKNLINIPETYINLEKIIINDCSNFNIDINMFNKLSFINGNIF